MGTQPLRPASKMSAWAGDVAREAAMRAAHRLFVTQALDVLS